MGLPTRGQLMAQEGSLKGKFVAFMFNPTEYSIAKANKWENKGNKSSNVPKWEFGGGEPRTLQVALQFDTSLKPDSDDVRLRTNQLFKFMMIDAKLKNQSPKSKMGQPPKCRMSWGKDAQYHFDCYITNCQVKYTLFNIDGVPIRADATLTLKEVKDPDDLDATNPTSTGDIGRRIYTVQEGDRLDWIAYQEYGDSTQWRRIAEGNGITNPLDLQPGMVLSIPPL
jgi:contractile injection system tube protein/LysM domain-containing protein